MTTANPIADLLAAPLPSDWTMEGLAEQLLDAIPADAREFSLDFESIADRQSRRLLRPLLACLATKSASESGAAGDLYGGPLFFERPGTSGPTWIVGQFENRPECVRVTLRRSSSRPATLVAKLAEAVTPRCPPTWEAAPHPKS